MCSPFLCITKIHNIILFISDDVIADRFSAVPRCSVSCFISWPLRGELSWSCSHSVEDNAQEMFASHLGHDKHHSLCLSFILFPSRLRLVGSAFCLLRSLSCFLLALPKSVPCLEMFGFLYSITIYACVRMCVIQFVPKALCCLLIRAWWCTNCRRPKWQKTSSTWFVSSGVLKFALEIVHWIFFSLLWVKAYGDFYETILVLLNLHVLYNVITLKNVVVWISFSFYITNNRPFFITRPVCLCCLQKQSVFTVRISETPKYFVWQSTVS